jgi:hypothetical protein
VVLDEDGVVLDGGGVLLAGLETALDPVPDPDPEPVLPKLLVPDVPLLKPP